MVKKQISLDKIWQELKRRNVFSVITTYTATAYIIIEVSNNLIAPLHLPDWIATLIVLLLISGFPVVIILSWIFDFTPHGIKKTESLEEAKQDEIPVISVRKKIKPSYVLNAILIIVVIILAYPRIFNHDKLETLRARGSIAVAIMPFQNMTNDTTWNIWQDAIQNELITSLTSYQELKVRQTESINGLIRNKGYANYASITTPVASMISQKLDADLVVYGTIKHIGSTIRLNAQLIHSRTEEVLKSFQTDGAVDNILNVIDSLSLMVKDYLIITDLRKETTPETNLLATTRSPEAYRYFIYGNKAFMKKDYSSAVNMFSQALKIDTNFTFATLSLSVTFGNQGLYDDAKKWCLVAYRKRDKMPIWQKTWINWVHAIFFETPFEEIKYLKQLQEIDDQYSNPYSNLGYCYNALYQYDKAIPQLEKVLDIYKKWDLRPGWVYDYTLLGYAYHKTGQFKKEKRLYRKAEKDFPDDPDLINRQAILSLAEGDTVAVNDYIEEYIAILKENQSSDADIATSLGMMYTEADFLDHAEEQYCLALSLDPDQSNRLNNLAYFLIDKDREVTEGMELVDKALEAEPDNYDYVHTKGWALYKQGKYNEALELLAKSWELNPVYNHELYLHIEEAKKAVAELKSN